MKRAGCADLREPRQGSEGARYPRHCGRTGELRNRLGGAFGGALAVRVEGKRQGPPKLHDLPSLQKLCSSRFGWPAGKTLQVAQELYDGPGKKIIAYPRGRVLGHWAASPDSDA
jgi:DNA topoisomerase IA